MLCKQPKVAAQLCTIIEKYKIVVYVEHQLLHEHGQVAPKAARASARTSRRTRDLDMGYRHQEANYMARMSHSVSEQGHCELAVMERTFT